MESVRRVYAADPEMERRAVSLITIANVGAMLSLPLAAVYGLVGSPTGTLVFGGLALAWPAWYLLVTRCPRYFRMVGNLFVMFVALSLHLCIALSEGLHSPIFTMQVIIPLTAILMLRMSEVRIWAAVSLLALGGWYFLDLPSSDYLIIGDRDAVRMLSSAAIFFATMNASSIFLQNRKQGFQAREAMEAEMRLSQAVIGGIVSGQMEERQRLMEELSRECGPGIARIGQLYHELPSPGPVSAGEKENFHGLLQQLEDEIRRISQVLPAPGPREIGLLAAVSGLCSHLENSAGIGIVLQLPAGPEIPLDTRNIHIYRILQEAFHNIVRHAKAGAVRLHMRAEEGQVLAILLEDDGVGIANYGHDRAEGSAPGGQGLQNIHDRVALLNGQLRIESHAGGGTRLKITLPNAIQQHLKFPFQ